MRKERMREGFTLIELLVVIAIIAILAAILFPVFAQAREKARLATCLSNQKQVATGLMMYAQDYDESFPAWPFGTNGVIDNTVFRDGWQWSMWIPTIMPYVKNNRVFACPSGPTSSSFLRGPAGNQITVHLAFSEYIMNSTRGLFSLATLANQKNSVADIAVVAESVVPGIYQDWPDSYTNIPGKAQPFGLYRIFCANGVGNTGLTCTARHIDNGINIVFADGHAKFVPGGRMQGGSTNSKGEYPIINPAAKNWFD